MSEPEAEPKQVQNEAPPDPEAVTIALAVKAEQSPPPLEDPHEEAPSVDAPSLEEPPVEEPPSEAPPIEEPSLEEPPVVEPPLPPVVESHVVEHPVVEPLVEVMKDEPETAFDSKRAREEGDEEDSGSETKKAKTEQPGDKDDADPIPASKEGTSFFNDADVLSGRGGGTNVHPGNRNFRDLINLHRRAYLKARKNDKPAISRAIVRSVRDNNGRFLRKDDKSGLWFEIGDDAAREKTSQALRQRAPEMRKLLFDTEREEARSAAEDHVRHQRMMMGMPADAQPGVMPAPGMQMPPMAFPNPAFFQAMAANGGKPPAASPNGQDPYQQMFQAAIMNNNMNRFPATNGGP